MSRKAFLILSPSSISLETGLVAGSLAHWPQDERPKIESVTFDQLLSDDKLINRCGMAWIILDHVQPESVWQVIALIAERHIPTLMTRADESMTLGTPMDEGPTLAPPDTDPRTLCALLRTLWQQASAIQSLQSEITVLHRHHGGLCDQIGKIDEELRLAAQLQREFLPIHLPQINDVEFHVVFRPAGYVSGDIYDIIRLDEDHIGFFLADAVGHGVPAALMTMFMKRSLLPKEIHPSLPGHYRIVPPNEALARLNADMIEQGNGPTVKTGTAVYGVINCRTLELLMSRAGHPFPMILRENGKCDWIEPDGAMLGVFPEENYELIRVQLHPGDRLLIYSDGVEVAFPEHSLNQGGRLATTNYTEELQGLGNGTMEEAFRSLEEKLDLQYGSLHQRDDLTLLCMNVGKRAVIGEPSEPSNPETLSLVRSNESAAAPLG